MNKKPTKLLVTWLVVAVMLISCIPVGAIQGPGAKEFELSDTNIIDYQNAVAESNSILFNGAGSVTFDYFMPFDSDKLNISYSANQNTFLTITTDNGSYQTELLPDAEETSIAVEELVGSTTLVLSASNEMVINSLCFDKIDELFNATETLLVELTPYDEAILTSVIIKNGSSVMKVKGATRFLDIENRNLVPKNYNGSLYVPVKSFAEALSLYCEDYPDKAYLYFAGKDEEMVLVGGTGHFYNDEGSTSVTMNVLYDDGKTWVPFRALAEFFGYYVTYRDGIAVADDRLCALNVVEDETVFTSLTNEMNEYIPTHTSGKTYHVAQSGAASDANSGTEKYPFKTLQKAASVAKAGDTVVIHEGTYRETLAPEHDGTDFAPIRFVSADGEDVTISALEEVEEFVPYKDNIYCASVPVDLGIGKNQIFYKGKALTEGRHPNSETKAGLIPLPDEIPNELWPTRGDISVKVRESNIATSENDLNQTEKDYWKGGTFVTLKGLAWSLATGEIIGSSYGQIELKDHDDNISYGLGLGSKTYYKDAKTWDYGYITNHINTVDMPGEWYCADNMLFLYPPEGVDLQSDVIEIKARTLTVDLRNRKNIIIENINTIGGSMTMAGDTEDNLINGGHHQYLTHFTRILDGQAGYEDGDRYAPGSPQRGEMGIYLNGENNAVINTMIDFSAGAGIYTTGLYSYIHNNTLRNAGYGGIYPGGITVELERWAGDTIKRGGHTITHNTVANTSRAGLQVSYCNNKEGHPFPMLPCELAYNRVYNGSVTARDTGVFYTYGVTAGFDRSRSLMHHNMVYNIIHLDDDGRQDSYITYFDGLSKLYTAYDNLSFYEDEPRRPASGFFVQTHNLNSSNTRTSGHLYLGHYDKGIENLKTQNFPNGKPYYAGSYTDGRDRFMLNYENYVLNDNLSHYPSSEEDNTYLFEDVKIKGGVTNRITMYYKTKPGYGSAFTADVSLSGAQNYETKLPMMIKSNTQYNTFYNRNSEMAVVFLPNLPEGEYDITVKLSAPEASIMRLRADESDDNYIDVNERSVFMAGSYDEIILNPLCSEAPRVSVNPGIDRVLNLNYWGVSAVWAHDLVYKDRDVKSVANALRINYGTHGQWSGSKLLLRVDNPESEPVCEVVLEGLNWVKQDTFAKLSREIQPGKHTFYLDFEGTDKTGDFANFELFYDSENLAEGVTE